MVKDKKILKFKHKVLFIDKLKTIESTIRFFLLFIFLYFMILKFLIKALNLIKTLLIYQIFCFII